MFATRCEEIAPFTVMQLLQRAAELEAEGQRVVHFEIGESDFPTATPILDAATMALKHGRTKYTPAQGIPELRAAISSFYASNGVAVAADRIIVTAGASGGLVLLASLLLNPGDELLITDPGYPCDGVFAHLVGARPRSLPVTASGRFQPTPESIQKAWSDRCTGMLLASPTNPTGTMSSRLELDGIIKTVAAQGGFFILDEIYQHLVHRPRDYCSGLELSDDIYVLNSFSKFFGMTGWRLGWVVVPQQAVAPITKLAPELYITLGAKGSTVYGPRGHQTLPGIRAVAKDSNGAGDIYAGACLAARLKGAEPPQAAAFGNFAAARIVAQYGARLESREAYQRLFAEFF